MRRSGSSWRSGPGAPSAPGPTRGGWGGTSSGAPTNPGWGRRRWGGRGKAIGSGRAFCAGADTRALEGHVERGAYDPGVVASELARPGYGVRPEYDHAFAFHYGIPKPIVAAVNGAAAGVGLVLACYCDVRFA